MNVDENRRQDLADRLAVIARALRTQSEDVDGTLDAVVAIATNLISGCDETGVTIVQGRRKVTTPAATGDVARAGDAVQVELNEGPCLDSLWNHETVTSADLAVDPRWPVWGPRVARELGGAQHVVSAAVHGRGHPRSIEPVLAAGRRVR
ncbi:MAG: hypothetical protein ABIZ07_04495 [Dermatophilaceae bacterium]